MNKIGSTLIIISAFFIINLLSQVNVFAATTVEGPCPLFATHHMVNTGKWVNVKYGSTTILTLAGEYHCDCGEYFVCEGRPHLGHPIGKYYDGSRLYNRQFVEGYVLWNATSPSPSYTSNSTITGYAFNY
ncbi:MAG: hypothetical protein Q7I98_04515 [Erysipelotrichaceae bacterium]|nr:hypothetical protein [Erysipelotrichaceae bacterium]